MRSKQELISTTSRACATTAGHRREKKLGSRVQYPEASEHHN